MRRNRANVIRLLEKHPQGRTVPQIAIATGLSYWQVRNILQNFAQPVPDSTPQRWRLGAVKMTGAMPVVERDALPIPVQTSITPVEGSGKDTLAEMWQEVTKGVYKLTASAAIADFDDPATEAARMVKAGQLLLSIGYALQQIADKPDWLALAEGSDS